jgi:hypothetical protein
MNKYLIDDVIAYGINLEAAIESLGYKALEINPSWSYNENKRYHVYCQGKIHFYCEWIKEEN